MFRDTIRKLGISSDLIGAITKDVHSGRLTLQTILIACTDLESIMGILYDSPLFNSLEDFNPFPSSYGVNASMWCNLLPLISGTHVPPLLEEMMDRLLQKENRTYGERLFSRTYRTRHEPIGQVDLYERQGIEEDFDRWNRIENGLDAIQQSKLLSGDEILAHAPALAGVESIAGSIWHQIAHRRMANGLMAEAAQAMEKALSETPDQLQVAKANRMLELAWILYQSDPNADVQPLVAGVSHELLNVRNLNRLKRLASEH